MPSAKRHDTASWPGDYNLTTRRPAGHGPEARALSRAPQAFPEVRMLSAPFHRTALASGCAIVLALAACAPRQAPKAAPTFDLEEATIADLQKRMQTGQDTARSLAEKYLARIEAIDRQGPALHAVIEVNPDALAIADALDAERKAKGPRGPLHGIPVLIKDNIATADHMMTTAGSLALEGATPSADAFLVTRLRAAGAVILGKANLSEWANFRSRPSSSGWSGRGGQVRNPYALDRNPSGSSSGSAAAVAASLCAVAVGTETDGSIVSPSNNNGIVGIKPTLGLISRTGIIPISHSQDTAGPMARTVTDAVILLGAMAGTDPADPATAPADQDGRRDYTPYLDANGLRGARLGVVRDRLMGYSHGADRIMEAAIKDLERLGAVIVDPTNIPTLGQFRDSENQVLLYEFKTDLNKYLASLGPSAKVHSLADLIAFDKAHADREMRYFGQELFEQAQAKGPLTEQAYVQALARDHRMSQAEGIDAVMTQYRLDALIAPTGGPAWLTDLVNGDSVSGSASTIAAVAGYPHITVPAGQVFGLPVGLSFIGRAWSEPVLIKLAYAYEQGTKHRQAPKFLPTAPLGEPEGSSQRPD
jgi:amidase